MKSSWKLACALLGFWLVFVPTHAASASPKKSEARATVMQKQAAKAKARVKGRGKGTANIVSSRAKTAPKPGSAPVARTVVAAAPVASAVGSSVADASDEARLGADVAAARRLVAANPASVEGRERLAQAAIGLIDGVLRSEARGDSARAGRLVQKLKADLPDVGWRIQKFARMGDLRAKQANGFLLGRGLLLDTDAARSCAEFIAAAEQLAAAGWHAAQCQMEASPDKAWAQMQRAAGRGHAAAQEWMGRRCLGEFGAKEKDYVCARDYLTQSASQGRSRAQTLLAYLLTSGQGGSVDVNRAIRLYTTAAEQGDADAQNNLGEILETGRGGSKKPDEAMAWYERAAESGLGSAQFNAGRLWAIGVGEKRDHAKARALLAHAEEKGIAQARQVIEWLDQGSPGAEKSLAPPANGAKQEAAKAD